jgi:hypothetical protein
LHKIRFTQIGFLLSSTAFRFLQRLSDFLQRLSEFLQRLSKFLQWLSDFPQRLSAIQEIQEN